MTEHFDPAKSESKFRSQLREVAVPLLLQAALTGNLKSMLEILEAVNGPLDHTSLIQTAMEGKMFAVGLTDRGSREKLFQESESLVALANSK